MAVQRRKSKSAPAVKSKQASSQVARKKAIKLVGREAVAPSAGDSLVVRDFRERLGLSRKLFSRLSGYSERAVAEWETGKALSGPSRQRMVELVRLQRSLAQVMKEEFIPDWLQAPNDAFAGLKPLEVVERGEIDRLWRMIYRLESGVPG